MARSPLKNSHPQDGRIKAMPKGIVLKLNAPNPSREAATEYSPRRKPWEPERN
jgi:hypothetical protein